MKKNNKLTLTKTRVIAKNVWPAKQEVKKKPHYQLVLESVQPIHKVYLVLPVFVKILYCGWCLSKFNFQLILTCKPSCFLWGEFSAGETLHFLLIAEKLNLIGYIGINYPHPYQVGQFQKRILKLQLSDDRYLKLCL